MITSHRRALAAALAFAAALSLGACAPNLGARALPSAGIDYNAAIARANDEQLLLNLVRLRYRDSTGFMEVSSVINGYSLSADASSGTSLSYFGDLLSSQTLSGGVSIEESPTITMSPLSGSDFARRLLTPLSSTDVALLTRSGWSVERLLLCCVERVNDLSNAPSASGPTPERFPDNSAFRALARALRDMQSDEALRFETDAEGGVTLVIDHERAAALGHADAAAHAAEALGGRADQARFPVIAEGADGFEPGLGLRTRSLLGALYTLSHAVSAPPAHESAGLVTVSRTPMGAAGDWEAFLAGTFRVESAADEPGDAFVKVKYRGHWFWIADDDLTSKTTFSLVNFLMALQSASDGAAAPLLSLGTR